MQATVSTFDPDRGDGTVVLDDGLTLPFTAEAFAGSGLRHVRPGQRLTVSLGMEAGTRAVVGLRLGTVGTAPPARATRRR